MESGTTGIVVIRGSVVLGDVAGLGGKDNFGRLAHWAAKMMLCTGKRVTRLRDPTSARREWTANICVGISEVALLTRMLSSFGKTFLGGRAWIFDRALSILKRIQSAQSRQVAWGQRT
jgi:hypothetical protein